MNYTVYDTVTGEILKAGDCPEDLVSLQAKPGQSVLAGWMIDDTLFKIVGGVPVVK